MLFSFFITFFSLPRFRALLYLFYTFFSTFFSTPPLAPPKGGEGLPLAPPKGKGMYSNVKKCIKDKLFSKIIWFIK